MVQPSSLAIPQSVSRGAMLSNVPLAGINEPGGILDYVFQGGISSGIFPLVIFFLWLGTLINFGPF